MIFYELSLWSKSFLMEKEIPKGKKIILFDGVCNLCNSSVNRVIKHDKKNTFLFASLQSNYGKDLLDKLQIDTELTDSIILYERIFTFRNIRTASG